MDFNLDEEPEADNSGAWMATFADLSTLLLTFFILMLSFANLDIQNFRMALGSVKDALGVKNPHPGDIEAVATSPIKLSERESTASIPVFDERQLLRRMRATIENENLENEVELELGDRGVIVRVKGHVLFDVGEATLRDDAVDTLGSIVELAEAIPFPISIEGHTDDRPIKTNRFPSNWELSTARATAAMRHLAEHGIEPKRVGVAGYAHMRPLVPNDSEDDRARNRRVEFVFITPVEDAPDADEVMGAVDRLSGAAAAAPDAGEEDEPDGATPAGRAPSDEPARQSPPEDGGEVPEAVRSAPWMSVVPDSGPGGVEAPAPETRQ